MAPFGRAANVAGLLLTLAYLGWFLALNSPLYRGADLLHLAAEQGHFVPIVEGDPPPFGGDFLSEWLGGDMVRHGDSNRLYDNEYVSRLQHDPEVVGVHFKPGEDLFLFYPPSYYLVVMPFSLLPIQLSALLWLGIMIFCLIAAAILLQRACPETPYLFPSLLLAALLFGPAVHSLNSGQKGTLWLLVLTATFWLLRTDRPFRAGLVFGLLAFKPPLTLAIGLTMLLKWQWRFVGGSFVMLFVVIGLSLAMGPDVCVQYVRSITGAVNFTLRDVYPLDMEHSAYGFFALLFRDTEVSPNLVKGLSSLTGLLALAAVLWLCRGPLDFHGELFTLQFAGLVLATALMSLKLQLYDLTILLLPVVLLLRLGARAPGEFAPSRIPLIAAAGALFLACSVSGGVARATSLQVSVLAVFAVLLGLTWLRSQILWQKPEAAATIGK